MKAIPNLNFTTVEPSHKSLKAFVGMLKSIYQNLTLVVNGNLGFGDGTNSDNVSGSWINVVAPAAPNTDFTVTHNLNRLPVGYWAMQKDRACDVYTGSVTASKTTLTLRATVASAVLRLFVVGLLLSIFASKSEAQGTNHTNTAQKAVTSSGASGLSGSILQPISGAVVTICNGSTLPTVGATCTGIANIFSNRALTSALSNPTNADTNGNYTFWASPGPYVVSVAGTGLTTYSYAITLACNPVDACTVSGAETFTGALTDGQWNNIQVIDGVKYPATDAGLFNCITAAGANGTCLVPTNTTIALTTSRTFSTARTTLRCENGAILNFSAFVQLTFSGVGDRVESCFFNGAGIGVTTNAPLAFTGNYASASRNTFTNFGSTSGTGTLNFSGSGSGIEISDNWLFNNQSGIEAATGTNATVVDVRIVRNHVDMTGGQDVGIFAAATASGSTINNIIIANNIVAPAGPHGCILAGAFGGLTAKNINITGNSCRLTANLTGGQPDAIGLSAVSNFTVTGNTVDFGGFGGIGVEINQTGTVGYTGTVSGNTFNGASLTTATNPILCDVCSNTVISNNAINGFSTSISSAAIYLGQSLASVLAVSNNSVTGNVVIFPTGGAGKGVWIQTNGASITANGNSISGNTFVSDGTANSTAIMLEHDTGTLSNTLVGPNEIIGPAVGVNVNSGVTNTKIYRGFDTATTPIIDNGTGTLYEVERATTDTLTNKTIDCTLNTLAKSPCVVYSTVSASTNASIGATTMATAGGSGNRYRFGAYVDQTVLGAGCSTNTTIAVSLIFTDPNNGGSSTITTATLGTTGFLGQSVSIITNGAVGPVATVAGWTFQSKASAVVQYSTTVTAGTCTTVPSYQLYPVLEQTQ
jgi:hypothetical protein